VVDRACGKHCFNRTENVFDHPQLFVLFRYVWGGQIRIGPQYPQPIKLLFTLYFLFINAKAFITCGLQIFSVAFVADEALIALL
jgi:hypothetical protein